MNFLNPATCHFHELHLIHRHRKEENLKWLCWPKTQGGTAPLLSDEATVMAKALLITKSVYFVTPKSSIYQEVKTVSKAENLVLNNKGK